MILVRNEYLLLAVISAFSIFQLVLGSGLIEVFQWKQMDFYNRGANGFQAGGSKQPGRVVFPGRERLRRAPPVVTSRDQPINTISRWSGRDEPSSNTSSYIAYNNVPMGATHFNGRLFITMPRRRVGIPSTLNYIDMKADGNKPSPKLKAYPNFETNYLDPNLKPNSNRLVSVYRTSVDDCKRLWFIDTGMLEYPGNRMQIQRPTIWVIDLLTDRVVKRFEIPQTVVDTGRGLASITIDVSPNKCDEAFAYIPDLVNNVLDVYSLKTNRMWTFQHNYFKFDPLAGDLNIGGQTFRWDDGIFSITLGPNLPNGYRQAYFHAMASTNEFMVSTEVLQNEANAQRDDHGNDFTLLGSRGSKRQSTMHEYNPQTGVVFYSEIHRNAVGCWNTNKEFLAENHGTVAEDAQRMIYPSDLTIDDQGTMWIMTNSMPIFIYSNLDTNIVNFRVWKQNVVTAAKNTVCE